MIKEILEKLLASCNLTEKEAISAMEMIMEGRLTPVQIAGFVTALRAKGETVEEITGCAKVMRQKAGRLTPDLEYFIDTCGTGGDGANTYNISTTSAIIAAAGGVHVAKHGNRAVSSKSGSADVLEHLGINIMMEPEQVKDCIEETGMGFMFAPVFHQSMKHAALPRKELGIRTVFNILGPLTNPANSKGQILGVYKKEYTEIMAKVLGNLGVQKALVVHGSDGLDEITTTGSTYVAELNHGSITKYSIKPGDFEIKNSNISDLEGGNAKENAQIILSVLNGDEGPKKDIAVLNAAAAFYVGKVADSIYSGCKMADEIISSGRALQKLEQIKNYTAKFA